ncbi:MAG TPA: hypothetical protein VHN80_17360 [Kineosporiaceae bacterium]|nr:hypothetical protein [Kineosporiaceae bacterium]
MAELQPVVGRPRVVAAATQPARREGTIAKLNRVVAAGGTALLITADGGERPPELADGVELLDLQAAERALGLNKVITRDPMRLVRRAQGKPIEGPSWAWARLTSSKPYRLLRPWLLWRALRHRLRVVRVDEVDHVLIVHQNSWPIAWELHRLNPKVTISYEVPDELFVRHGHAVPPALQPEPAG